MVVKASFPRDSLFGPPTHPPAAVPRSIKGQQKHKGTDIFPWSRVWGGSMMVGSVSCFLRSFRFRVSIFQLSRRGGGGPAGVLKCLCDPFVMLQTFPLSFSSSCVISRSVESACSASGGSNGAGFGLDEKNGSCVKSSMRLMVSFPLLAALADTISRRRKCVQFPTDENVNAPPP